MPAARHDDDDDDDDEIAFGEKRIKRNLILSIPNLKKPNKTHLTVEISLYIIKYNVYTSTEYFPRNLYEYIYIYIYIYIYTQSLKLVFWQEMLHSLKLTFAEYWVLV